MTLLRLLTIIGFSVPATLFGAAAAAADDAARLFADHEILELTMTAPMTEIMGERFYDEDSPGRLTYTDPEAGEVTLDIGVRTRGRYRRQYSVCRFAPLRLNFKKSETKNTLFEGSNKMKLVTHCRENSARYSQAVLREYLAYRIFNLITDNSFRVRLLRVTYVDSESGDANRDNFAFLIEHREQLAERLGIDVNRAEQTEVESLDGAFTNLGSMFQYLIGNTDFSAIRGADGEVCCHNNVLFGAKEGEILAIPYDFDMSGLVDAPYATPNPKFGLRSVKNRLYRGRCLNDQYLEATALAFQERRADIYALLASEYFDERSKRYLTRFVDEFFATLDDPKQFDREIRSRCEK